MIVLGTALMSQCLFESSKESLFVEVNMSCTIRTCFAVYILVLMILLVMLHLSHFPSMGFQNGNL